MPHRAAESFDERAWAEFLTSELGVPVRVRFGRATSSVLRVVQSPRERRLHMSRFFERAPLEVRSAVATWMRGGRGGRRVPAELDRWIDAELAALHRDAPTTSTLDPRGARHDLGRIAESLFEREFEREFDANSRPAIGWGRMGRSRGRRSLRLGSFDAHRRAVRIHPVLDQDAVPEWFVRYILFHELLHAALPHEVGASGRRVFHGAEFRARERAYRDYARALEWEKRFISRLIASARRTTPMRQTSRIERALDFVQGVLFSV